MSDKCQNMIKYHSNKAIVVVVKVVVAAAIVEVVL